MTREPKRPPIAEVTWVDSMHYHHGWTDRDERMESVASEPPLIHSVGYLIARSRHSVSLCWDWDGPNGNLAGTTQIPRCAVRSIRVLEK